MSKSEKGATVNSQSEIENIMINSAIDVAIISSYFDFDDYENPVHYYLQDLNIYGLISTISTMAQYQVKKNRAVVNDDICLGSQGFSNEIIFYSIDRKAITYSNINTSDAYLQIFIALDPQVDQFYRSVYSFMDLFGFIGGIYGLFKTFGIVFVSYFSEKTFYSSILSQLYHIESEENKRTVSNQSDKPLVLDNDTPRPTF